MRLLSSRDADLAFLGSDKLAEWQLAGTVRGVEEVDRLPLGCRIKLAGPIVRAADLLVQLEMGEPITVATSYPELARKFARERGYNLQPNWVVQGGCEGFAASGRSDVIFDIAKSGKTIDANGLKVLDDTDELDLVVLNEVTYDEPGKLERGLLKEAAVLAERWNEAESGAESSSYTVSTYKNQNAMVKKLGEELAEVLQAALRTPVDTNELANEAADLMYRLKMLAQSKGVGPLDIYYEEIRRNQLKGESL